MKPKARSISFFHCSGEEAISIASAAALITDDLVFPQYTYLFKLKDTLDSIYIKAARGLSSQESMHRN